jgi:hypothetical protein
MSSNLHVEVWLTGLPSPNINPIRSHHRLSLRTILRTTLAAILGLGLLGLLAYFVQSQYGIRFLPEAIVLHPWDCAQLAFGCLIGLVGLTLDRRRVV